MSRELSVKLAGDCDRDGNKIDSDFLPMTALRPAFDPSKLLQFLVIPLVQFRLRAYRHIHEYEARSPRRGAGQGGSRKVPVSEPPPHIEKEIGIMVSII